jgi:hypothetical protein
MVYYSSDLLIFMWRRKVKLKTNGIKLNKMQSAFIWASKKGMSDKETMSSFDLFACYISKDYGIYNMRDSIRSAFHHGLTSWLSLAEMLPFDTRLNLLSELISDRINPFSFRSTIFQENKITDNPNYTMNVVKSLLSSLSFIQMREQNPNTNEWEFLYDFELSDVEFDKIIEEEKENYFKYITEEKETEEVKTK